METETDTELPQILAYFIPYADEIRATAKDSVSFKLKPATDMTLWQSKVGGEPYLPLTEPYPLNAAGIPLMLLLQINFSEMPHLPGYPEKGILEFYIDGRHKCMGSKGDDLMAQEGFRVLYFENVMQCPSLLQRNTEQHPMDPEYFPLEGGKTYSVEYRREKQYVTQQDYRFDLSLPSVNDDDDLLVQYSESNLNSGLHRIGGYPTFIQGNIRDSGGDFDGYELLVQLDTDYDDGVSICWGDSGIGGFYIKPADLKERNFSKVIYYWESV